MYVIRSMSTTDFDSRTGQRPMPYHIYLQPSHKRGQAWWTSNLRDAQQFETAEAAEAEAHNSLVSKDPNAHWTQTCRRWQVAPVNAEQIGYISYWDAQKMEVV